MAREIDQAKLPEYRGKFSWVAATLCAHIEAVMPDYDRHDPKTWPLVTSDYLRSFLGHEYDGTQLLPPYVAYERGLVNKCVGHFPDQEIQIMGADRPVLRGLYFHHFPFVYNFRGQARNFEYMHADHYIKWVSDMAGTAPITRTKGKDVSITSSTAAFTECLEMLEEAQSKSSVGGAESSKQELKDALAEERRLHEYTKSASEAETKMLRTSWNKEKARANAAEVCNARQARLLETKKEELRAARADARYLKKELEAAKKEAATAQGHINIIRDEMKKTRGNQT